MMSLEQMLRQLPPLDASVSDEEMAKAMKNAENILSGPESRRHVSLSEYHEMTLDEQRRLADAELGRLYQEMASHHGPCPWSDFKSLNPYFQSAAEPPACSDKCCHCSEQYLPKHAKEIYPFRPVKLHTDRRATVEINVLIAKIEANREKMRGLIGDWGDAIIHRWSRRSPEKRRKLILAVNSEMYPNEHMYAEFHYEKQEIARRIKAGTHEKSPSTISQDAAHTPYLNLVSLSENRLNLFSLMHHRAYDEPYDWIRFDCQQMRQFFHVCHFDTAYNPHSVVAYGKDFGKLVPWEAVAAHKWDTIGYAAARLALVAQWKLTSFLVDMMDLLLKHDRSDAAQGHVSWDEWGRKGFKEADADGTIWEYTASPFAAPPRFDANPLLELFESRMHAAKYDLFRSHVDRSYLRNIFERFNKSALYHKLDDPRKHHVLIQMTLRNVDRVKTWSWAVEEFKRIVTWTKVVGDQRQSETALPFEYELSLARFEDRLKEVFQKQTYDLGLISATLPAFEKYFQECNDMHLPNFKMVGESEDFFRNDQLIWNFHELRQNFQINANPPSYHFALIDKLIANSAEQRERLDQLLLDHLSDMAATDRALSGIKYHRSRRTIDSFNIPQALPHHEPQHYTLERFVTLANQDTQGNDSVWKKLEELSNLPMPSGSPTREGIAQTSALQQGLQSYWEEVCIVKVASLKTLAIPPELLFPYMISTSWCMSNLVQRLWDKDREASMRIVEAKEAAARGASKPPAQVPSVDSQLGDRRTEATPLEQPLTKIKKKTRPYYSTENQVDRQVARFIEPSVVDCTTRISVKARTVAFFSRMFTESMAMLGMTPWKDLVHAFVDAGFSATCHGGSAVTFKHESANKGAVVFDRPHPDSKITPRTLKDMGKQLTDQFGWNGDNFVLRSK